MSDSKPVEGQVVNPPKCSLCGRWAAQEPDPVFAEAVAGLLAGHAPQRHGATCHAGRTMRLALGPGRAALVPGVYAEAWFATLDCRSVTTGRLLATVERLTHDKRLAESEREAAREDRELARRVLEGEGAVLFESTSRARAATRALVAAYRQQELVAKRVYDHGRCGKCAQGWPCEEAAELAGLAEEAGAALSAALATAEAKPARPAGARAKG